MIETKDLKLIIRLLDEKIVTLIDLKNSLICKESDLEQRLGECSNEEAVLQKPDFEQAKIIESIAYSIIGSEDEKFLNGLIAFMGGYGL